MRIVESVKRRMYLLALLPLAAGLSIHPTSHVATPCFESVDKHVAAATSSSTDRRPPFTVALESCVLEMHEAMRVALERTGGPDATFAATMIAHHQGAIAMAQAELRFGRNEQLRRMAQEIIVTQQQEIAVMRLALGDSASVQGARSPR